MKKVLALDFGTQRIGLAISHHGLAEPLKIINNDNQVYEKVKQIIDQEGANLILIGLSENQMAQKTKQFAKKLKEAIATPIEFVDETLSSQNTHQKLASSSMKLKKRQSPIDHYAAAEFLQEWLDTN